MTDPTPARRGLVGALAKRPLAAALWILLLVATPLVLFARRHAPAAPLPVFAQLPTWRLADQRGEAYGSAQLHGRAWVANFMFTSCPTICPVLSRHMALVQQRTHDLGDRLHLVSISVDPVVDTPARLSEYGQRYHYDARRWHFVTGEATELQRIAAEGFRVALGQIPESAAGRPNDFNILHSAHIALVDGEGRIRGLYRADDAGLAELDREAHALVGR